MKEIEDEWFKKHASCPDASNAGSSHSLGLNSFRGLFLIAGTAASSALIIFLAVFVCEHRNVLKRSDPRSSLLSRIRIFLEIFASRDLSAHNFRDKRGVHVHSTGVTEASPHTGYSPNPSSDSQHTDSNFSFFGEHGSPSTESGDPNPNLHGHP